MRNSLTYAVLVFMVLSASPFLIAQGPPTQWKFHFAFEDATGARDTIWLGLDENGAAGSLQPELGEVPVQLDSSQFNVYMYVYPSMETFKTRVSSINHASSFEIEGMNATLPIIVSWDTALFNSPVLQATAAGPICNPRLDSQWFFLQTNAPWLHNQFSMILDTQTILPEFWWGDPNQHFPIFVYFDRSYNCDILSTEDSNLSTSLQLYPNPCTDFLELRAGLPLQSLEVYDLHGRKLLQLSNATLQDGNDALRLDVSAIPPGMYMLHAMDAEGRKGVKKFVKGV